VPWRFSDAGCPRVGMVSASRHPKTCTNSEMTSIQLIISLAVAKSAGGT
jgi:hypothetical protein